MTPTSYAGIVDVPQNTINGENMSVRRYPGVIGNAQQAADGVTTNSSTAFSSASTAFSPADAGKTICINYAGGAVGSGATGTVTQSSGRLATPAVTAGGSLYALPPMVTITDATGTGGFIVPVMSGGAVTGLVVIFAGQNYTSPTITITARQSTLITTIASYVSTHAVTLATNALNSGTALQFAYGNDDTAGIQAAINSVSAVGSSSFSPSQFNFLRLPVPSGAQGYLITSTITVPAGLKLIFHNRPIFFCGDNSCAFVVGNSGTSTASPKCALTDGMLYLFTDTACGVSIIDCHRPLLENFNIQGNFSGGSGSTRFNVAVSLAAVNADCLFPRIVHCDIGHATIGIWAGNGSTNGGLTTLRITDSDIVGDNATGVTNSCGILITAGSGQGFRATNCNIEQSVYGIYSSNPGGAGVASCRVEGIRFESCTTDITLGVFEKGWVFSGIEGLDSTDITLGTGFGGHTFLGCYDSSANPVTSKIYGQLRTEITTDQKSRRIVIPNANRQNPWQLEDANGGVVSAAFGADGSIRNLSGGSASISMTSGSPNGVVPAVPGSICGRTDGSANPTLWTKSVGSGVATVTGIAQLSATITAISKAASAVVTATNTFVNGETVYFWNVAGMTQINGLSGVVSATSGSGFTVNINSTGFSTYTSGGTAAATRVTATSWASTMAGGEPGVIVAVSGLTQSDGTSGINGIPATVTTVDSNHFSFALDITGLTAYSSGGTACGARGWLAVIGLSAGSVMTFTDPGSGAFVDFLLSSFNNTGGFWLQSGQGSAASGAGLRAYGNDFNGSTAAPSGDCVALLDANRGRFRVNNAGDDSGTTVFTVDHAGNVTVLGEFGCNGASPQAAVASGGAVPGTGATNITPYGFTTAAQADDIVTLLNTIRAALVANGIMS